MSYYYITWATKKIKERHGNVTLEADIMYMNKIPFIITPQAIHFWTAELIKNENPQQLPHPSNKLCRYTTDEVSKFVTYLETGNLNILKILPGHGHQHKCDRQECTCSSNRMNSSHNKECIWAIANQLPFEAYPHRLIVEMVYNVTFWLNAFWCTQHKEPMYNTPCLHTDQNQHCWLEFRAYVQIHIEHDNSLAVHTTGAIALRPTGNTQGSHYFTQNINSGRWVAHNNWNALHMRSNITQTLHRLVAACKKTQRHINHG